MTTPARPLLFLVFILLCTPLVAQTSLQTFQLQHRDADELIPVIRPLLDPRGGISGTGYTLIVRSTAENLSEIAGLIVSLDTARRNLLITVRHDEISERQHNGLRGGGSVQDRHGRITLGQGGTPRLRIRSTRERDNSRGSEQIRVLEGTWAHIQSGQDMPVPQQTIVQTPSGPVAQQSLEYRDVSSGFEVQPRIHGDQVTLAVRPYRARPADSGGGAIATSSLITTVSGRLGEWIELGGHVDDRDGSGRGLLYSTRERDSSRLHTRVRVEVLE